MTTKLVAGVVAAAALLVAFFAGSTGFGGLGTGQNHYQKENFFQGLTAGPRAQFEVQSDGDIVLTKSTFCLNFYATSTATLVKMTASSTATIEGTDGVMVMQYGACS